MEEFTVPEEIEESAFLLSEAIATNPDAVGITETTWKDQTVYVVCIRRSMEDDDERVYPVALLLTKEQWEEVTPPQGLGAMEGKKP